MTPVLSQIEQQNQLNQRNYNELQKNISFGPALPENVNMKELDHTKELMNKIMKKYVD